MFRIAVLTLASMGMAAAQTQIDLPTQAKRVDFTGAISTKPVKTGAVLPDTCAPGEMFFKTDAPAGANLYGCAAAGVWTAQAGGGAGLTIKSNGVAVGSRAMADFVTGPGLVTIMVDTGDQVQLRSSLDTAVVETQAGAQSGAALLCASQGGSGNAYQCSLTPSATAYSRGTMLHWIPDTTGAGGPTTLDVDTLGTRPVKLADGWSDPGALDIVAGYLYAIWYDGSSFRLTGQAVASSGSAAWSTITGKPAAFPALAHGATHRDGGTDEIATVTPGAGAIPKADGSGKLPSGWLPQVDYATLSGIPGSFTPSVHKASHRAGGSDVLTAADLGAQPALGFMPENTANKGQANGYAALDATGKVPASQLPPSQGGGGATPARDYIGAKCQSGVAGAGFSLPSANAPTATCVASGSAAMGVLRWANNTANQSIQDHFQLPAALPASIDLQVAGRSGDSSHATILSVYTVCVGTGAIDNPTFGAVQTLNITGRAASGRTVATLTGLRISGCAGGDDLYFKIVGDTTSLTGAATFELISLRFTFN